jgi:hypothetical protein
MRHSCKRIGVERSFVKVWLCVKLPSPFHLLYLSTKLYALTLYIHSNWNSALLRHNRNTGTRFLQAQAYTSTCLYMHMPIHAHAYTCRCLYMHMPTHAHAYTCTCLYKHMPIHAHAYTSTCLHMHMPIQAHAYTCTCLYLHLPKHAHAYTCTCL